jgi:predicted amidohydrolase YtcJ
MCPSDPESVCALVNGIVRTQNRSAPVAGGILVRGNRIAMVGSTAEVLSGAGARAKIVDLDGRLALPGFIDSHTHFLAGGRHLMGVQLRDCLSPVNFQERIRTHILHHGRAWVTGGTWDHQRWPERALPTKELIDPVSPETPVFVQRLDGHMGLANSVALQLAGVTGSTADPPGGKIERDPHSGDPTGLLKERAMEFVTRIIPPPSPEQSKRALEAALTEAGRNGVTSVQDITMPEDLELFRLFEREDRLTVRIYTRLPIAGYRDLLGQGIGAGQGGPFLKVGSLKAFSDGSLGSGTAWFFDPYVDDPSTSGLPTDIVVSGDLRRWALDADKNRLQLSIHAIGDRANHYTLELFEEIQRVNPPWDRRWRVEHAQHVRKSDLPLMKALDVLVSAQPYHCVDDGVWAESRIGTERLPTSFAFRSFLDAGVRLCFGSDWTVAPLDPLSGMVAAVTRRTVDAKNPRGWIPRERITVEEAVRCYTAAGAYAAFEEREKGTLAAGMLADLVILSEDIVAGGEEALLGAKVESTIVDGQIVYER